MMTAGLRALLEGLWDYAGLFPPAELEMPETVRSYADHLAGPDAWMLGRLVVPVKRLDEFQLAAGGVLPAPGAEPWQLSALTALDRLERDLERIDAFNEACDGRAAIGVIELPARRSAEIDGALERIPESLMPFFEIPISDDPRGLVAALAGSCAGVKVRTGGAEPAAYPAPEDLGRFLVACAAGEVPFKATAGLHGPIRHRSGATGATEFGFLNLLVAAALLWNGAIPEPAIVDVLTDESAESFDFGPEGLRWRDRSLPVEEIEDARIRFASAIGSCSFTEPLDLLRTVFTREAGRVQ